MEKVCMSATVLLWSLVGSVMACGGVSGCWANAVRFMARTIANREVMSVKFRVSSFIIGFYCRLCRGAHEARRVHQAGGRGAGCSAEGVSQPDPQRRRSGRGPASRPGTTRAGQTEELTSGSLSRRAHDPQEWFPSGDGSGLHRALPEEYRGDLSQRGRGPRTSSTDRHPRVRTLLRNDGRAVEGCVEAGKLGGDRKSVGEGKRGDFGGR